ncbi:hypothetical protein D5S17_23920 [Pseudonocardiaceae bacterium YIM PH 21723]|nr:hypothetical protein D5S17_23920 [Pseudonocardiaceae bacterium YIM PH 21723]
MKRTLSLLLLTTLLAGCGSSKPSPEEQLGVDIVALIKQNPTVSDARSKYESGIDAGRQLSVFVTTKPGSTEVQPIVDAALKKAWQTPSKLHFLYLNVIESGSQGSGESVVLDLEKSDSTYPERAQLYKELQEKYGPHAGP